LKLRERTAGWFAENADRLSLGHSIRVVLRSYAREAEARSEP
jgi:hypothetical protein